MGMAKAGFKHAAVIERDHDACETFRQNQHHNFKSLEQWPPTPIFSIKYRFRILNWLLTSSNRWTPRRIYRPTMACASIRINATRRPHAALKRREQTFL